MGVGGGNSSFTPTKRGRGVKTFNHAEKGRHETF